MELEELEALRQQLARRKKRRKLLLPLGVLLLLLVLGAGWLFWNANRPVSRYDLDRNALEGFLPGHTQEEIEAELNRIIDKGRFGVSINPTPVLAQGQLNLLIENVPANHYNMQVDVFVTMDGVESLIYTSGIIQPGFYIKDCETDAVLPAGEHPARALFSAIDPETGEEIGETAATLLILVGEGVSP